MKQNLTERIAASLKYTGKLFDVRDLNCRGLFIRVGKVTKTYYYNYRDKNSGKQINYKIGDATAFSVSQAREEANKLKVRLSKGEDVRIKSQPEADTMMLDTLLDEYEPSRIRSNKSGQITIKMIRSVFKQFLGKPISELNESLFIAWCEARIDSGVKKTTVSKNIVALRTCFDFGVDRGFINTNPLKGFQLFKKLRVKNDEKEVVRYLTDDENERLFAALNAREKRIREGRDRHIQIHIKSGSKPHIEAIEGQFADYLKPLVIVALFTGLRRGSLFSLQWGDIDFDAKSIILTPDKHKSGFKTNKTLRLNLNKAALDTLIAWRGQCKDKSSSAFVFPSPRTGKRLDNISSSWEKLMKAADIKDFRFNDLRHTFASRLAMKGVPLNNIRESMGHSDIKMTLRYAHLSKENMRKAVETLDEYYGNNSDTANLF